MNHVELVANLLAVQRNQALNALAESEARLAAAQAEISKLQQRLHDAVADNAGPSGAVATTDAFGGS
jgi:hypothetical protein